MNSVNKLIKEVFENRINVFTNNNSYLKINNSENFGSDSFQKSISRINENQNKKKENGVYYTPEDVACFITSNCFCRVINSFNKVLSYESCIDYLSKLPLDAIKNLLFSKTVFDPTSGCGEFLVAAYKIKLCLLEKISENTQQNVLRILSTIYGNDINNESNCIAKLRLISISKNYLSKETLEKGVKLINNNFTAFDMLLDYKKLPHFDFILGNPPYVEKVKQSRYGNIYADILDNSCSLLNNEGSIGFIIPVSFVSTTRMYSFRKSMENNFKEITVLNYADRPACLFNHAHQKLTILFSSRNSNSHHIFTSKYNYWYKKERQNLFNNIQTVKLTKEYCGCYPKVSTKLELNVLDKIFSNKCSINTLLEQGNGHIFLNMRGYFWMKSFSFNPGSSEYKMFNCDEKFKWFILSILNSSLFFFFWVSISDCWHITSKELKNFFIPSLSNVNLKRFNYLGKKLEQKLEITKERIGTKQAEYAYKHKFCKDIIDLIDCEIAKLYAFSDKELDFIKNFSLKYRMGE